MRLFKWKDPEKADLLSMVKEGKDYSEIAKTLNTKYQTCRTPSACRSKHEFLKKHKKV